MIAINRENLYPTKIQGCKKRVYLCTNKQGDTKTFKVNCLTEIPVAWGDQPLFLGFTD